MPGKPSERQASDADDEPPLLEEEEEEVVDNQRDDGEATSASIMDEMVAVATLATAAKRALRAKERSDAKGFGAGLKKGFFASTGTVRQKKAAVQRLDVDESARNKKETSLLIVNKTAAATPASDAPSATSGDAAFVFPEVQDALKSMNNLNPKEWMNEKLFAKMANSPKLLQALQNPRFTQVISELQQNPQAAVLKYQRDADVSLMLRDFMEFLGNHFEELGKEQETKDGGSQQQAKAAPPPPPIVDLDEARREAIANIVRSPEEEQHVQRILQNPELLAALSDANLMEKIRQCQQDPRVFQQLTNDPVLGPKLRLLIDAKMVAFA